MGCNNLEMQRGPSSIKIGRLHSEKAMLKRDQEWETNWNFLVQYSAGALHELSLSESSVHGFNKDECAMGLQMYYMLTDEICYMEAEEDLSTDEDENLILKDCREREPQSSRTASDDTLLPDLLLPDLNPVQSVSHRSPPYLSPVYTFNPADIEVKYRPYVLLERLNKDLEAELLADPQKRVFVETVTQSRMLRKRNNDKAAPVKEREVTVNRKCVKKRASRKIR